MYCPFFSKIIGLKKNFRGISSEERGLKKNFRGVSSEERGLKKNFRGVSSEERGLKENFRGVSSEERGLKTFLFRQNNDKNWVKKRICKHFFLVLEHIGIVFGLYYDTI